MHGQHMTYAQKAYKIMFICISQIITSSRFLPAAQNDTARLARRSIQESGNSAKSGNPET